jgi:hypothetical protein
MWRLIVGDTIVVVIGGPAAHLSSTTLVLLQTTDHSGQPIVGRSTKKALDNNEIQV